MSKTVYSSLWASESIIPVYNEVLLEHMYLLNVSLTKCLHNGHPNMDIEDTAKNYSGAFMPVHNAT